MPEYHNIITKLYNPNACSELRNLDTLQESHLSQSYCQIGAPYAQSCRKRKDEWQVDELKKEKREIVFARFSPLL